MHLSEYDLSKKKYKQVKVNLDEYVHQQLKEFCDARNITMAEHFRNQINTKIDDVREPQKNECIKLQTPKFYIN